ncbi:hypothetical protein, partial [Enterobacter hormaechei]|uniref:hypothetical protein n=1 Tax=Enterobacter hormaechei TaxID=158836 RepID=UPI0023E3D428
SISLYDLKLSSYPMKVQGLGGGALHTLEDMCAHAGQPKTLKYFKSGFLLHHASKRVFPSKVG